MEATSTKARLWANGWMPLTTGDGPGECIEHPDGEVVTFPNLVDAERFADAWNQGTGRPVSEVQERWELDVDIVARAYDQIDEAVQNGSGLHACPVCRADDALDYSNVEIDDGAAYQRATCSTCDAEWVEAYSFNRVLDVSVGTDYVAEIVEVPHTLKAISWMLDEHAQGRGEGDPRIQLAAALLADAEADAVDDAPKVRIDFAHYLLSEYAEEKDA